MREKFSLVELIIVIAILAILASLIIPNTADINMKAYVSKVNGNIRNIQTAVDMYALENGKYPSVIQPTLEEPQEIDFNLLYPKYLKSMPKIEKEIYWVDFMGKVWSSTIDAPRDVFHSENKVEWGNEKKYQWLSYL